MANDWIKMRMNLVDDPAVIGIAAKLKLERYAVVGRLQTLWSWADEHSVDGFMPHVTAEVIDEKLSKPGFAAAMASPGVAWLVIEPEGVTFPKFERHNGESAKRRAVDMEKKRTRRAQEEDAARTERGRTAAHDPDGTRTNGAALSPPARDKNGTREEKRREEYSGGGGTPPPPTPPEGGEPPRPPQDKIVDQSDFDELATRFPLVDIAKERDKALAYVRTKRGQNADVELRFFSEEWLPKAPARGTTNGKSADDGDGGPPEWQAWMDKNFPDWIYASGKDDGARKWSAHTSLTQKYVREMMKKAGAL